MIANCHFLLCCRTVDLTHSMLIDWLCVCVSRTFVVVFSFYMISFFISFIIINWPIKRNFNTHLYLSKLPNLSYFCWGLLGRITCTVQYCSTMMPITELYSTHTIITKTEKLHTSGAHCRFSKHNIYFSGTDTFNSDIKTLSIKLWINIFCIT